MYHSISQKNTIVERDILDQDIESILCWNNVVLHELILTQIYERNGPYIFSGCFPWWM